jgi:hypothetical protein
MMNVWSGHARSVGLGRGRASVLPPEVDLGQTVDPERL